MDAPLRIRRPSAPEAGASDVSTNAALSRDLHAARQAYESGDTEGSRRAHALSAAFAGDPAMADARVNKPAGTAASTHSGASPPSACEPGHDTQSAAYSTLASSYLDGIFLSCALLLLTSSHAAAPPLCLAALLSLSLAQGVRSYMRYRADGEHWDRERARESWELRNYFEGEVAEMVELYTRSGVALEDARVAITALARYPSFFVDMMMVQELGLIKPDTHPLVIGVAASAGMLLGAVVPALVVHALVAAAARVLGVDVSAALLLAGAVKFDTTALLAVAVMVLLIVALAVAGVRALTRVRVGVHVWMYATAAVGVCAPALVALASRRALSDWGL